MTFIIRMSCPTVNDWHGPKASWKYPKIRRQWEREFPPAAKLGAVKMRDPKGRVTNGIRRRVTITRLYPKVQGQRRYDSDNLRAGCKPILDVLKMTGWIVSDAPKWCELDVVQRHPEPGEWSPATIVEIGDLEAIPKR